MLLVRVSDIYSIIGGPNYEARYLRGLRHLSKVIAVSKLARDTHSSYFPSFPYTLSEEDTFSVVSSIHHPSPHYKLHHSSATQRKKTEKVPHRKVISAPTAGHETDYKPSTTNHTYHPQLFHIICSCTQPDSVKSNRQPSPRHSDTLITTAPPTVTQFSLQHPASRQHPHSTYMFHAIPFFQDMTSPV